MSIPVLVQVYDEMRRLAIAGSAVAPGDFRLRKLIPPLEQAGAKAPVFGKVAQAAQAVVDSDEKTAANALLELTTLLNAILYTQGATGIAGELRPLETVDLCGQHSQASARVLKPLLEALTSTGSGRMELVKDAFERGTFKDLRLVKPAMGALDDSYSEISQFMAEKVLPLYGKAIVPELRAKLDIKGRGGHVHRLELLHRLDPEGSRELIQAALNDGSKEMKVAAIECLGTSDSDLPYLLEQVKAKAKDVRAAALRALTAARSTATDAVAALKKAIAGPDLELIVASVKQCALPEVQDHVLAQAEAQVAELLACKEAKLQGPQVGRMQQLVMCLDGRSDEKAEAFVLRCFEKARAFSAIKSEPSGADLNEVVAHVMVEGTPRMQRQLVAEHKSLAGGAFTSAVFAARATLPPDGFFAEFSPLLKAGLPKRGKKMSAEQERGAALASVLTWDGERPFYNPWLERGLHVSAGRAAPLRELDPRWLDAAVDARSLELVCRLARPGHAGANQFLSGQLAEMKESYETLQVLETMVRIGHPGAAAAVIDALRKSAKSTGHYYVGYWYGGLIADLPRSALPEFEALLPTLPEKMVDQLMDSVLALKDKPE